MVLQNLPLSGEMVHIMACLLAAKSPKRTEQLRFSFCFKSCVHRFVLLRSLG